MIDTHCHLLPGTDDGPRTLRGSLELGRALADAGVRTVVCTPHFSRRFPTDHVRNRATLGTLAPALRDAGIEIDTRLAAEVGSAAALQAADEELWRRRLGDRYLLVELESNTPAGVVALVADRVVGLGLLPVFAHPERCRAVRADPGVLDPPRDAGAMVQVVAPSLAGRWGDSARRAGWQMLEAGQVDVLASDSHRREHAGRRLVDVRAAVAERFGDEALRQLVEENPRRMLAEGA